MNFKKEIRHGQVNYDSTNFCVQLPHPLTCIGEGLSENLLTVI